MPSTATDRLYGTNTAVAVKAPVRAVSAANLTLSGLQTVGGVALVAGDRVLVKDQASAVENGIYEASTSAWQRTADFDGLLDVVQGTLVVGSSASDLFYRVTTANPITPGSTAIAFEAVGQVTTAAGLLALLLTVDGAGSGLDADLLDGATASELFVATPLELGHATDTTLTRASAGVMAVEGVNVLTTATGMKQGLVTVPVLAVAMQAATTNGAASGTVETTTNKVLYKTLDFDTTTQEFAGFAVPFPKSFNNGTLTFQPIWTFASGSGGVVWALQALAASDDDAIDAAYGTEQTSTDTTLTAGDVHVGPTSAAITIAGTPATGDMIFFRVKRNPANASDTLAVDARLIGIRLFFTQNAADDT